MEIRFKARGDRSNSYREVERYLCCCAEARAWLQIDHAHTTNDLDVAPESVYGSWNFCREVTGDICIAGFGRQKCVWKPNADTDKSAGWTAATEHVPLLYRHCTGTYRFYRQRKVGVWY